MKYEHYSFYKTRKPEIYYDAWLTDDDLNYMANENGWLLINIIQVDARTRHYTFRKEVN